MKKLLVTGFNPFDERGYNTSAEILDFLPDSISGFGLIFAEKCRKMDSIRIFLKTALRILLLLEIYMKQMVVFQM